MVERERERALHEPDRSAGWLTRLFERKMANGGGPDYEGAQRALLRLDAMDAREPFGFEDEEVEDSIDAAGLRKNRVEDWPVVPWSYWEARGAGPHRR